MPALIPNVRLVLMAAMTAGLMPSPRHDGTCRTGPLEHEGRNIATIIRLEHAWSVAYLRGDTALERCLLTPDFTEIMRSGEVKGLRDELAFAMKNAGRTDPIPDLPTPQVLIHGDAAVAFAKTHGSTGTTVYADFYVWIGDSWHVYFAQQTAG